MISTLLCKEKEGGWEGGRKVDKERGGVCFRQAGLRFDIFSLRSLRLSMLIRNKDARRHSGGIYSLSYK